MVASKGYSPLANFPCVDVTGTAVIHRPVHKLREARSGQKWVAWAYTYSMMARPFISPASSELHASLMSSSEYLVVTNLSSGTYPPACRRRYMLKSRSG